MPLRLPSLEMLPYSTMLNWWYWCLQITDVSSGNETDVANEKDVDVNLLPEPLSSLFDLFLCKWKWIWYQKNQQPSSILSRRRPLSYRNQSIDLQSKSMDWFLYDNGLRLERVKRIMSRYSVLAITQIF